MARAVRVILLDTHVLIWMDADDDRLGIRCRRAIEQAWQDGQVAVSAISFWESAMLHARGRIELPCPASDWRRAWLSAGLAEIALDGAIATSAAGLDHPHRDPADRFILATALHRQATLVTADVQLLAWGDAPALLDARR